MNQELYKRAKSLYRAVAQELSRYWILVSGYWMKQGMLSAYLSSIRHREPRRPTLALLLIVRHQAVKPGLGRGSRRSLSSRALEPLDGFVFQGLIVAKRHARGAAASAANTFVGIHIYGALLIYNRMHSAYRFGKTGLAVVPTDDV